MQFPTVSCQKQKFENLMCIDGDHFVPFETELKK